MTAKVRKLVLKDGWEAAAVVYPHPDYEGKPWSQWGQGVVANGRFFSAIGDELNADGNSFVYEFDPQTEEIALIADARDVTGHRSGDYGFGKIHAQAVPGPCGEVYMATYWGSRRKAAEDRSYHGDHLLRLDPSSGTVEDLGIPFPRYGIPSLAASPERGLLYGEAVDVSVGGSGEEKSGIFFVYDLRARKVVHQNEVLPHVGFRNILVDGRGDAYYAAGNRQLNRYDAERSTVLPFPAALPGQWLRASTRAAKDGSVYGVTREPDALFVLTPEGEIRELGPLPGYVTSIALDERRNRLLFISDAHGGAWRRGAPLDAFDLSTRKTQTLVELNDAIEEAFGLKVGGTYGIAVDPAGERVYIGLNAGPPSDKAPFGEVVLVALDLH